MEGYLDKFTNFIKGWQPRYFVLDNDKGTLSYYMSPSDKEKNNYRGSIKLSNAKISLDIADPIIFKVECGEISFKLQAKNLEDHQKWVSAIQSCIILHKEGNEIGYLPSETSENIETYNFTSVPSQTEENTLTMKSLKRSTSNLKSSIKSISFDRNSIISKKLSLDSHNDIETKTNLYNKILDSKNHLLDLNNALKEIRLSFPSDDENLKTHFIKNSSIVESIVERTVSIIEEKRGDFLQLVRTKNGVADLSYLECSKYVLDRHIDLKTSFFFSYGPFIQQFRLMDIRFEEIEILKLPPSMFQTKSFLEILAESFLRSDSIFKLISLPFDEFYQIATIIEVYLGIWKNILKLDNFVGIPLFPLPFEFSRNKLNKSIFPDIENLFLNFLCQYIVENNKGYYVLHLEDILKTFNITFTVTPSVSFTYGSLRISLSGEAHLILINLKREYIFDFPQIFVENLYSQDTVIELVGDVTIRCIANNSISTINFLKQTGSFPYNRISGHIKLLKTNEFFSFNGIRDNLICFQDKNLNTLEITKIQGGNKLCCYIPSPSSLHICESRKLWKPLRKAIRSKDVKKLNEIYSRICETQNTNSFHALKLFKRIGRVYILNRFNLF